MLHLVVHLAAGWASNATSAVPSAGWSVRTLAPTERVLSSVYTSRLWRCVTELPVCCTQASAWCGSWRSCGSSTLRCSATLKCVKASARKAWVLSLPLLPARRQIPANVQPDGTSVRARSEHTVL